MSAKLCACGFDISRHGPNAKECYTCRSTAKSDRACTGCGDAHRRRFSAYCEPCSSANWLFSNYGSGRAIAALAVAKARAAGELISPTLFKCVDCGEPANCYDHRDYNRPLIVDPVCKGCNIRRGPAIPREWSLTDLMEWVSTRKLGPSWSNNAQPDSLAKLAARHFKASQSKEAA